MLILGVKKLSLNDLKMLWSLLMQSMLLIGGKKLLLFDSFSTVCHCWKCHCNYTPQHLLEY